MFAASFEPLRRTDFNMLPSTAKLNEVIAPYFSKVQPLYDRLHKYAPLIAMTPLSHAYHISVASIAVANSACKAEYKRALIFTAYIGGIILAPIAMMAISQLFGLVNSIKEREYLRSLAIIVSTYAITAGSLETRIIAGGINFIYYWKQGISIINEENPDYENAFIHAVCGIICITNASKAIDKSVELMIDDVETRFESAMDKGDWKEVESLLPQLVGSYKKYPNFLPRPTSIDFNNPKYQLYINDLSQRGADASFIRALNSSMADLAQIANEFYNG